METPLGGPLIVSPRHLASPEDGAMRPEMMRSSVDLPDPDRPSRPTISPERSVRSTFSSTSRSSPLPFGKDRQTPRISRRLACLVRSSMSSPLSAEAKATLSEGIERPPEQPVEERHQNAHDGDAENDPGEVTGFRRRCYIGTETGGRQMVIAPTRDFGDDRGIPRSARGGDGACDVVRKNPGQDDFHPPPPSPQVEAAGGLAKVGRE